MGQTLSVLADAGLQVSIKPDGKTLSVLPAAKLTASLRIFIIQHKAEILAELQAANETKQGVVIKYKLGNGKSGYLISKLDTAGAIGSLFGIYGDKLDLPDLINTLQAMGEAAKQEADKLLLRL
mgnify:CR=1 FL=1